MAGLNGKMNARYVLGPDGGPLTFADLPPETTKRWVARRKAEVVCAVRGGLLTLGEACQRYEIHIDEYLAWDAAYQAHGLDGLKPTRR